MWTTALACYFALIENPNRPQLNSRVSCCGVLVSAPWGTLSGWSLSLSHVSVVKTDFVPLSVSQATNKHHVTSQWRANQNTHTQSCWFPKMSPNFRLFSTLTQMHQLPNPLWPQAFWETQTRSHDAESRKPIHQSPLALPQSPLRSCYLLEEFSTHQEQNITKREHHTRCRTTNTDRNHLPRIKSRETNVQLVSWGFKHWLDKSVTGNMTFSSHDAVGALTRTWRHD